MKTTNKEISQHFSQGDFPFCYEYFGDDIKWTVVGAEPKNGRENVISFCEQMMKEMANSTLKNTNVIAQDENIAIEGICNYLNADNIPCQLAYCDVYHFESNKIDSITSYCIEKNNGKI